MKSKFFNTINKQWSDVNVKTNRKDFDVVHYLNQVWIVGGLGRDDDGHGKYIMFNTIQTYDLVNKTTSLSPVKMVQARKGHKVIVYKNKLFVFGGYCNKCLNSVEMYSPNTKKFIMMAPMKIARSSFACCRVGNLVYVIGGLTDFGFTSFETDIVTFVEIYNLDTNTWTRGENFPVTKPFLHACAVNNKL